MKYTLIIAFLFLQSCLLFGSEDDPPTATKSDAGVDVSKEDVPTIEDVSKPEDVSTVDTQIEDVSTDVNTDTTTDAADCGCGENEVCVDEICVCLAGFVSVAGECSVGEVVKTVTRLAPVVLAAGSRQIDQNFSSDEFKQVIPFLTARSDDTTAPNAHVLPKITDGSVGFSRVGMKGEVTISANLVEFDEQHVDVFRGELDFLDGSAETEILTMDGKEVDPSKAFLVFYATAISTDDSISYTPRNTSIRGTLQKDGIKFTRSLAEGSFKIRWYVAVSKGDAFNVVHENTKIEIRKRHSTATVELQENTFVLWSNLSHVNTFAEGHIRCQHLPVLNIDSVNCSRGVGGISELIDPIEISVQKIHFSNPNFTVRHNDPLTDGRVNRSLLGGVDPKQTAISGQLGSAGTTMLIGGTPDPTDPDHHAMGTLRMLNYDGKDIIEIERNSQHFRMQVSVQFIQWH